MNLMLTLKEKTAELHTSIEKNPFAVRLFSNQLDQAFYRKSLEAFYGYHLPLEQHLYQHAVLKPLFKSRAKELEEDLADLGCNIDSITLCQKHPNTSELPAALGVLYVLEGSRMGGQMIAHKIRENTQNTFPVRFFTGLGDETPSYWKSLSGQIEHLGAEENHEKIIGGAKETFISLENWLFHAL